MKERQIVLLVAFILSVVVAGCAPKLDFIDPSEGYVGDVVALYGSSFGQAQGTSVVSFNSVDAGAALAWGPGMIEVEVPVGATSGDVVVIVEGAASNAVFFEVLFCWDDDGDGYDDEACGGDDCDDSDPLVNPGAIELCDDEIDNDCDGLVDYEDYLDCISADADGDGYYSEYTGGDDCDDTNEYIYPGADEICNGVDDDCDGDVDEDFDVDGDGYTTCDDPADCDDTNALIYPGANEICTNGLDNDCDGDIDFDDNEDCPGVDADGDGYDSEYAGGDDCDDTDPAINPGALEEGLACYDGADNDCDGLVDWDDPTTCICPDNDGDGFDAWWCGGDDCHDGNADSYPGADEICDGADNDCDDQLPADEADVDGDGAMICAGDCDDTNDRIYPGAAEICFNGVDDDCDGDVDFDDADCDLCNYFPGGFYAMTDTGVDEGCITNGLISYYIETVIASYFDTPMSWDFPSYWTLPAQGDFLFPVIGQISVVYEEGEDDCIVFSLADGEAPIEVDLSAYSFGGTTYHCTMVVGEVNGVLDFPDVGHVDVVVTAVVEDFIGQPGSPQCPANNAPGCGLTLHLSGDALLKR